MDIAWTHFNLGMWCGGILDAGDLPILCRQHAWCTCTAYCLFSASQGSVESGGALALFENISLNQEDHHLIMKIF